MRDNLLARDAFVSMEFVQTIASSNDAESYFVSNTHSQERPQLESFFQRITDLPNVLRANIYAKDETVIWSSNKGLIGKKFDDNPELRQALQGQVAFHLEQADEFGKAEHADLPVGISWFLENYIPIWNSDQSAVIGSIELYKSPVLLFHALDHGKRLIAWIFLLGGLVLYVSLFWIVRRANLLIDRQQQRLLESEKLAIMGEMATAVTHSLRNPLSAIRSSAELAEDALPERAKQRLQVIIDEVDNLDQWVKDLLICTRDYVEGPQTALLNGVIAASLEHYGRRPEQLGVKVVAEIPANLPKVKCNPDLLTLVLVSLIANALEAMPQGGRLTLAVERVDANLVLSLSDTGLGIAAKQLDEVFRPLVSYKRSGLGVGLGLARRILRRYGGELRLVSREHEGTTVSLNLPVAQR